MLTPTQPHLHVLVPNFHASIASLEGHILASVRMRSALIARAAENMGWRVTLGERFDTRPDVLYVGKIGGHRVDSRGPAWLQYIAKARKGGSHVIVDYTDHYCGFKGVMTEFYNDVLKYADQLVTPSATMTQLIKQKWLGDIIEIPDPCEIEPQMPRAPGCGPWRALWFGSCTNVRYLTEFLSDPNNLVQFRQVNIVTDAAGFGLLRQWVRSLDPSLPLPHFESFEWSLQNLVKAAAVSDIAIIPSDPSDPRKAGVSENRLVTAIQLGLVTVAAPLPAYLRLAKLFVTLSSGWQAAVSKRESIDEERAARRALHEEYSKSALIGRWMSLLAAYAEENPRENLIDSVKPEAVIC